MSKRRETQIEYVQAALSKGRSVSALEMLNEVGCFRLAAVIHLLRKSQDIDTDMVTVDDKVFARYKLTKQLTLY